LSSSESVMSQKARPNAASTPMNSSSSAMAWNRVCSP
jgi:hypothetical protein